MTGTWRGGAGLGEEQDQAVFVLPLEEFLLAPQGWKNTLGAAAVKVSDGPPTQSRPLERHPLTHIYSLPSLLTVILPEQRLFCAWGRQPPALNPPWCSADPPSLDHSVGICSRVPASFSPMLESFRAAPPAFGFKNHPDHHLH